MAFQDIAHGLVTEGISEVGQSANDPVIAPGAIFPRHAHHQRFELWVNCGTSGGLTLLGTVKLLRNKCAVPGENRVRFDDSGHCFQGLLPQLLTNLGECCALAIRQPHTTGDLVAQDTILCHQVLVAQQQFLIDRPCNVC